MTPAYRQPLITETDILDAAVEICERVMRGCRFDDACTRVGAEYALTPGQQADAAALALNALNDR